MHNWRDLTKRDIRAELSAGVATWRPGHWLDGMTNRIMLDINLAMENVRAGESAALERCAELEAEVARLRGLLRRIEERWCWPPGCSTPSGVLSDDIRAALERKSAGGE